MRSFTTRILFLFALTAIAVPAFAATPQELEAEIQAQSRRLEELNKELSTTENSLNQVRGQKQSLEREVRNLDGSIRELDLRIKSDEVTSKKLEAEIGVLEYDSESIRNSIEGKKLDIAKLVRDMQKEDSSNLFLLMFGNDSLAEVLRDAQAFGEIRNQISRDISSMTAMAADYEAKMDLKARKKREAELSKANSENRKVIVADRKEEKRAVLTVTQSQEAIYQEKVRALKAEQDKMEEQIEAMEQNLRKDFDRAVLPIGRSGILSWPVEKYVITQRFGVRSWLYRGKGHNGMDLGIPVGTPVYAAADGTVMGVDNNDRSAWSKYQYGKYVMLKHENGLATLYGHLSRYTVSAGASVKRGDLIGYSGNTGYSTGPHLHMGLYWASSVEFKSVPPAAGLVPVGVTLDPQVYL